MAVSPRYGCAAVASARSAPPLPRNPGCFVGVHHPRSLRIASSPRTMSQKPSTATPAVMGASPD